MAGKQSTSISATSGPSSASFEAGATAGKGGFDISAGPGGDGPILALPGVEVTRAADGAPWMDVDIEAG
jgi:hypothetical protein